MDGKTSKEDGEHQSPGEILGESSEKTFSTDTVPHGSESKVAESVEDDDDGEPDFEGVEIVLLGHVSASLSG